eukprot:7836783-Alexandrium_andersonii.AAC.1
MCIRDRVLQEVSLDEVARQVHGIAPAMGVPPALRAALAHAMSQPCPYPPDAGIPCTPYPNGMA